MTRALPLVVYLLLAAGCTPEEDLVIDGDVTVSTEAELAKIAEATQITGALKVKRASIARLHLPAVDGSVPVTEAVSGVGDIAEIFVAGKVVEVALGGVRHEELVA